MRNKNGTKDILIYAIMVPSPFSYTQEKNGPWTILEVSYGHSHINMHNFFKNDPKDFL